MANKKQERSVYTQEFRNTAIKLALAGDKPIATVARELGIVERKLYDWVKAWKKKNGNAMQSSGSSAEEQLKQLQKRNKQLELELEILKKAAAYFAKTLL
jgi:transposase